LEFSGEVAGLICRPRGIRQVERDEIRGFRAFERTGSLGRDG
jgi:hypothetical protein